MAFPMKWTPDKIALLRELYPSNFNADIAHHFGCSPSQLAKVAYRHGIRKNPEIRAQNGAAFQFRKGQAPHNKGKKWDEWMSEEGKKISAKTQFKNQHLPHNTAPMYAERTDMKDGYIHIKVPGHRTFVLKHRWIWEMHNGPIPKGCQIHFLDGDRHNCDISNLELITRAECAKRNCCWNNYPEDVAHLFQLKGALNRQINKNRKKKKK